MSFQSRLLDARKRAGLTQSQLAERIGIAKSTYTGYEKGTSEPDMHRTILIMHVLGIDANYLWQDEMRESGIYDASLSDTELTIVQQYRHLDAYGQKVVSAVLDLETERCAATKRDFDALYARQAEEISSLNNTALGTKETG